MSELWLSFSYFFYYPIRLKKRPDFSFFRILSLSLTGSVLKNILRLHLYYIQAIFFMF